MFWIYTRVENVLVNTENCKREDFRPPLQLNTIMAPKPKPVPSRLGPPPQLSQLQNQRQPPTLMQRKFQPKMREIAGRQAKLIARWLHANLTWKKVLMSWMVLLVASKMVLLMLTYEYFTLTALISLQVGIGRVSVRYNLLIDLLWGRS